MTPSFEESDLSRVLSRLEASEERLLAWGLPDVVCAPRELEEIVASEMPAVEAAEVIQELVRRCWVRRLAGGGYRSRSAETVRLLARLRQMFEENQWESGLPLVADFRYRSTPRRVPVRTLGVDAVQQLLPPDLRTRLRTKETLPHCLGQRQLSAFQVRSMLDLLGGLDSGHDGATIVTAGTGAGKTMCFYLPALLARLGEVEHGKGPYIVAIYPRIELLRDQAQATVKEVQRLNAVARRLLGRPLSIGAFYSDTPLAPRYVVGTSRVSGVWQCPFMRCWQCKDAPPLVWRGKGDSFEDSPEQLECAKGCGAKLGSDEVRLTRASMSANPPDIVFTTMESLNNLLQNTWSGACVGVNTDSPSAPRFVLLDEVHTYGGITGAQQALVLRRWRYALRKAGKRTQFVGLSATIREPKPFMAALVGIHESYVRHVEPRQEEMVEKSRRYHVALRGDPISASALLSTSIQALLLMTRMVDAPVADGASRDSVFGKKVFAFCDTLDVWRRLFDNLRDAEENKLPRLRARDPREDVAVLKRREDLGQLWGMGQDIGHDFDKVKRVDAVSSQMRGVAPGVDVVVATASLELGFDDPEVGVVLQHKAPRDAASFVQRMGRAGRRPEMRPWIVCVLSDYGRDRLAYAAYEELFEPVLGRSALPIGNLYILRMQAGFSLCDWLSQEVARGSEGKPIKISGVPNTLRKKAQDSNSKQEARKALRAVLLKICESEEKRNLLCDHLQRALRIERHVALDLMWQSPRGIITEMVPAMLRILEDGGSASEQEFPVAAYLPANLFTSLVLPQVKIRVPGDSESKDLPVAQALREFAAGRVSRRFSRDKLDSYWIAPVAWRSMFNVQDGKSNVSLAEIADLEQLDPLGSWEVETRGVGDVSNSREQVSVFFPLRMNLRKVPKDVNVSSNAIAIWHNQIVCRQAPQWLSTPSGSALHAVLPRLDFLLHSDNRSITARRFTTGSQGTVSSTGLKVRREAFVQVTYRHPESTERTAALGMQTDVDALALDVQLPVTIEQGWKDLTSEVGRARRVEFYRRSVQEEFRRRSSEPGRYTSTFSVDRLLDLFLAGVAARASKAGGIEQAVAEMRDPKQAAKIIDRTLRVMLRSIEVVEGEQGSMGRLGERIEPLAKDPAMLAILVQYAGVLHENLAGAAWRSQFLAWMRERSRRMVLEAVLEGVACLLPDFDTDNLHIDLDEGALVTGDESSRQTCCWITESEPGGMGTLEALRSCYVRDPDRFMAVIAEAVRISPDDFASAALGQILRLLVEDSGMQERAFAYRVSNSLAQTHEAAQRLIDYIEEQGMVVGHALRSSIFLRFLRPGSTLATDRVTHAIHQMATKMAEQLGIEVDARCVAYVAAKDVHIGELMSAAWPGKHSETWQFNQAYSLLWPTTRQVRLQRFQGWQPFLQSPPSDPDALLPTLPVYPRVSVAEEGWFERVGQLMDRRATRVDLVAAHGQQDLLRSALLRLACEPHDVQALHLHAEVEALERKVDGSWVATVRIPEVFA